MFLLNTYGPLMPTLKKIPEFDMKIPEKFSGKIQITDFFPRMTKTGGKFRKSGKKSGFPENFPDFRKTDEYRSGPHF